MRQRSNRYSTPLSEINIVPYIDVMLVLLVIFMVTTPLLTQGVKVSLPRASAKAISQSNQIPIIVTVNKQGDYFLNISAHPDKPISPIILMNRIAAQIAYMKKTHQTRKILVKGDEAVHYGKVVTAMVLLQKAGAQSVGLITKPGQKIAHG